MLGDRRTGAFYGRPLEEGAIGRFRASERVYAPRQTIARHRHERPYLCYVVSGRGVRRFGLAAALLAAASSLCLLASDLPSPAVDAAQRLALNGRFHEAKGKLASILEAPAASRDEKDDATVELARIEWRIDDRLAVARARLIARLPEAKKKAKALLLLSRMERTLQRFEPARAAARQALQAADTPDDHDEAALSLAQALVDEELLAAREGKRAAFGGEARGRLSEALTLIAPVVALRPGVPAPARTLLDAALLLDDGPQALVAFRSYFASAGTADSLLLSGARLVLDDLLPRWKGPQADRADRTALVRALADSRFFTEAVLIALDARSPAGAPLEHEPFVRDLVLYEAFLHRSRAMTDDYYRDVARGKAKPKRWRSAFEADLRRLWKSLRWEDKAPPFDDKLFEGSADTELGKRFGTLLTGRGKTGDVEDLHAGHRVIDEKRSVEQYGRRATVRIVALDAMISSGYETWTWDGNGAHGGWGRVGFIVQVRPACEGRRASGGGDRARCRARREGSLCVPARPRATAQEAGARLDPGGRARKGTGRRRAPGRLRGGFGKGSPRVVDLRP